MATHNKYYLIDCLLINIVRVLIFNNCDPTKIYFFKYTIFTFNPIKYVLLMKATFF